jgi:hypothetical protein
MSNFGSPGYPSPAGWSVPKNIPLTEEAVRQFENTFEADFNKLQNLPLPQAGRVLAWKTDESGIENRTMPPGSFLLPDEGRLTMTMDDYLKNGRVFQVADYAAGVVADWTAAFQAAATAAGAAKGIVRFTPWSGTYNINGSVTIPAGVVVDLNNAKIALWTANPITLGADAHIVNGFVTWSVTTAMNAITVGDRSHVKDVKFTGSGNIGSLGSPLYQRAVYGTVANDVYISGCYFTRMTVGVWSGPSSIDPTPTGWRVIGNRFYDIVGFRGESEGYALIFTPSSRGVIAHNLFEKIARHAVYLAGGACDNVVGYNGIYDVDNVGIQLNTNLAQPESARNLIVRNSIRHVTKTIAYGYLSATGIGVYGNSNDNIIEGNILSDFVDTGIATNTPSQDHGTSIVGHGNVIRFNFIDGSVMSDACIRCDNPDDQTVSHNILRVANNRYGIVVSGSFAQNIRGSKFRDNDITTLGAGAVAIRIASAQTLLNEFYRNDFSGPGGRYNSGGASGFTIEDVQGVQVLGDYDFTYTIGDFPNLIQQYVTLTAARAITLSKLGATSRSRIRVFRASTGAFNYSVKNWEGTVMKALATNQWAEFAFDGSYWYITAFGSL